MDGNFGLKKIAELRPQVITLDLEMPGMGGLDMLNEIMRRHRMPVIVVSSHSTQGASVTLKALSLGAFDFVAKPSDVSQRMQEMGRELISKIKAAAQSRRDSASMRPSGLPAAGAAAQGEARAATERRPRSWRLGFRLAGRSRCNICWRSCRAEFPGSIVVVQHMPEGFTDMFARRLDECCSLNVKEAQSGDLLLAGRVLICPGSRHMKVKRLPLGDIAILERSTHGKRTSPFCRCDV